jgi:copper(I)-binding protein
MAVKVPARGQLEFEPGSHHVMFMGLAEHWRVGDEIEVTLKFKIAGHLDIKFLVIPRP